MSDPGPPARRLFIWPEGADLGPVKRVALSLNLGYAIKPFWYDPRNEQDVDRVLALSDFAYSPIVDYIQPKHEGVLADAILWCVGEKELERGPHIQIDTLSKLFGGEVKEVWEDTSMNNWDQWPDADG